MVLTNQLSVFMLAKGYIWISIFRMFMVCIVSDKCNVLGFFAQALQKGKSTFCSEVFALAVYPAACNYFVLHTETQLNISKNVSTLSF